MSAPLLVLFDIDGTLVSGAVEAHRDAILGALAEVHGLRDAGELRVNPAGKTDFQIARELLSAAGPAELDAVALHEAACRRYLAGCEDDLSHTVLPGIRELLAELSARDDVRLALLTGNLETIARRKLEAAGIGAYFEPDQGAFGSDHELRDALPDIARRRAARDGAPHPRERTLIVGDTPRDIACARAGGVACVAVATGLYRAEQLREADEVVSDPAALAAAIRARI